MFFFQKTAVCKKKMVFFGNSSYFTIYTELLKKYYDGSYVELVCDYIRFTEMTWQEVEWLLEEMRKMKGA